MNKQQLQSIAKNPVSRIVASALTILVLLGSLAQCTEIPERPDVRPFSRDQEFRIAQNFGEITSTWQEPRVKRGLRYFHTGIDYSLPLDAKILATGDGEVIFSQYCGDYGNLVIIKHEWFVGNKLITVFSVYGHLSSFNKNAMFDKETKKGDKVKKGQVIGYCGATGFASGTHVHYELRNANGGAIFNGTYQVQRKQEENGNRTN